MRLSDIIISNQFHNRYLRIPTNDAVPCHGISRDAITLGTAWSVCALHGPSQAGSRRYLIFRRLSLFCQATSMRFARARTRNLGINDDKRRTSQKLGLQGEDGSKASLIYFFYVYLLLKKFNSISRQPRAILISPSICSILNFQIGTVFGYPNNA